MGTLQGMAKHMFRLVFKHQSITFSPFSLFPLFPFPLKDILKPNPSAKKYTMTTTAWLIHANENLFYDKKKW